MRSKLRFQPRSNQAQAIISDHTFPPQHSAWGTKGLTMFQLYLVLIFFPKCFVTDRYAGSICNKIVKIPNSFHAKDKVLT